MPDSMLANGQVQRTSRIEEQEHAECVARVAARFGMTAEELDHDVCHACHIEDDCFYRAVFEAIEEPL